MSSPSLGAVYSIGAVSRMLGVPSATVRAWEDRYAVVVPERSAGGQRLYTREQVDQLGFVCDLLAHGATAADAHRALRERVGEGGALVRDRTKTGSVLILLAERDPFSAELAEFFLRTEGFDVILALDAAETERIYVEREPSVVVLDLMISGGRGLAACRDIAGRGGRVVAVSTLAQRERALDAGADVFLQKPLEPLALVSAVRDVLGTSSLSASRSGVHP
jgi:DNA-binding transcriptional MerR regulator